MKVLMIGAGRNVQGGVSTVVNQYYEAHLDEKVELKYISTMQDGSKLKKAVIAAGALIEFRSCVEAYDIVHVHMASRASFYRKEQFIKMANEHGKKVVIHMHGGMFDIFYEKECDERQKKRVRRVLSIAEKIIVLSEEWKAFFSRLCDSEKIVVMYNSVKMPEFKRTNYDDTNVLFLGRMDEKKGIYDILDSVPQIVRKIPQAHFYFGGTGNIEKLKRIADEAHVAENITFLGWIEREQKEKILKQCSTFVLPSYYECMPMSLLEAMSYGDVVVSTRVGGIPKVIEDKKNGYLVNAGDTQMLTKTLIEALTSESRREMGEKAYMTIYNKFNIVNNIDRLIELYESMQ